ncbi:MAG TPA: lactonase family protein [Candidatus Limnocylindrales bacterium]|nr:lactonase family protein [Candidatus Limnocylindrales bacterium]
MKKLSLIAALLCGAMQLAAAQYLVYAGTYTNAGSKGIYAWRFNSDNGKVTPIGVAAETASPSFLVEDASRSHIYAVNENQAGSVSAFSIDRKSGKLTLLNTVSTKGAGPCHLALDRTGRWLAVANYDSGNFAVIPVQKDGRLGEASAFVQHKGSSVNKERQAGPHAHCALFSPENKYLLIADLGLDKIMIYKFDAGKGSVEAADPAFATVKPGSGVRHLIFNAKGNVLYALTEMGSTVTAFHYPSFEEFQTVSMLPDNYNGSSTGAELAINPAGTFLYASNRGADSIAEFAIDGSTFKLSPVDRFPTMGKTPRHFAIDPTGGYLFAANQNSNDIVVFKVHPRTGQLTPTGTVLKEAANPVCVLFVK